jgi:hypothetical protein
MIDNNNTVKEIFAEIIELIDKLNILASKIENYNSKLPIPLMEDVYDLCFSLGSNLCVAEKEIGIKEDDGKEDNLYNIETL